MITAITIAVMLDSYQAYDGGNNNYHSSSLVNKHSNNNNHAAHSPMHLQSHKMRLSQLERSVVSSPHS